MVTDWKNNAIMYWFYDPNDLDDPATTQVAQPSAGDAGWQKITDHNRAALSISVARIEKKNQMVDGTIRRYTVGKKRTFSTSWENLPSQKNIGIGTADGGAAGSDIEDFHDSVVGDYPFWCMFKDGQGNTEIIKVMLSDYSREVAKRGVVDLWNVDVTLDEVGVIK